ncbi:uncharacterized protein LOC121631556 isoform X2 [Melanotaenia boesemani]|uniref:uncharacterized protein LOC121631556 isoform X2 n=1 Tax=Melanotaenia boesemani TaxID=1250792 RepID=UPI001C04DE2F|nr:uncharacterized protein LOC121631556 isoform X2 [Melanotaenia boesemani]
MGSNVAVLRLSVRPTMSDHIKPICLENGRSFPMGSTCWAAGWSSGRGGEEQILQEFQTSVQNCGNASTTDSIYTGQFTQEQVNDDRVTLVVHSCASRMGLGSRSLYYQLQTALPGKNETLQ